MAQFRDFRDWNGQWDGIYDGRAAALLTTFQQAPSDNHRAVPNFTYTEGENVWNTWPSPVYSIDAFSHRVDNPPSLVPFEGAPGRQSLEWPLIFIHTWDTNFISGISRWQGKDYGMWFRRRGTGPVTNPGPRRFTSWYAIRDGNDLPHQSFFNYNAGSHDGRPGTLRFAIAGSGSQPQQNATVTVTFTDSSGHSWQGEKVLNPVNHWIEDLQLQPIGTPAGRDPILWPRLYLHTWNVRHCTGWSEWNQQLFGITFFDGN